ncbi:MAG: polyketide synthase [Candidatus Obscuribacterales bacterium]|nr:polyketide synthase [Candidatus Obscuribacterales bacterium]
MSGQQAFDKNKRATVPVAIIGMSCIFPGAPSAVQFWENIINGVDSIREPGEDEWNPETFKNKPATSFGNIYCTRGGFITEYADFDPLEFGIMPTSVRGGDPDQFLALRVAADALADAGYHHKTFDGERAEVVIGRTMAPGVGSLNLIQHGQTVDQLIDVLKSVSPDRSDDELNEIAQLLKNGLEPCSADTIPAVMPNVLAGRIASKLGFRGRSLILDAACASSLIAVETAMHGLISGNSDLAIAGGVHVSSSAGFYQMFCGVGALSHAGIIRPFDDEADGTLLGEGVGMLVLKRLDDALRDGDRVYAAIVGIGSSSDGRAGGLLAPNVEGEVLAMRRAYEMAGLSPHTVELLEAHGTGTRAGDRAEMKAVQQVFCEETATGKQWCAIGSVKSMIGHTQAASGVAGLIKTALALHNKVLPPTLNVSKANSQVDWSDSPCYILSEARPWTSIPKDEDRTHPRRAAVSAFGFGGVNAHVILEEHPSSSIPTAVRNFPAAQTATSAGAPKMKLSLKFPYLKPQSLAVLQLRIERTLPQPQQRISAPSAKSTNRLDRSATNKDVVLNTFVKSITSAHQDSLTVQENVMLAYLRNTPAD